MNRREKRGERIELSAANPDAVIALMEYLLKVYSEYVSEHSTRFTDAFMAVHNVHKAVVFDIAERAETPDRGLIILQAAIDTFRDAVEQEMKKVRQELS